MSIQLYPSVAKIKRNGVYENLPGFVPEQGSVATQQMIASAESSNTAQYAHNKGTYFRLNDTLYQAIVRINVGDSIVVGTNCKVAVIGDDLTNLANSVADYELGIATAAHNTGEYFSVNNVLYKATNNIQIGDAISTSTNCRLAVLADEVTAQSEQIGDLNNATYSINMLKNALTIARASGSTKFAFSNGNYAIARSSATVANTVLIYAPVTEQSKYYTKITETGASSGGIEVSVVGFADEPTTYGSTVTQTFIKKTFTNATYDELAYTINVPSGINYIGYKMLAGKTVENLMSGTVFIDAVDNLEAKTNSMELITNAVEKRIKYVSTTGNDNNDGNSINTAYATFGKAFRETANEIYIASGNYTETQALGENTNYRNKSIKIIADKAILTMPNALYLRDADVDIVGLNIVSSAESGTEANCFFLYHCTGKLINCIAENATYMGFRLDSSTLTLEKCIAKNNAVDGFNAHTITNLPDADITLINCVASGNGDDGASTHEHGKLYVIGGEYYNNTHAGIAPHAFCDFEIINAHCHNNENGIEIICNDLSGSSPASGKVIGCILNANSAYGIETKNYNVSTLGNAYANNTSGTAHQGTGATITAYTAS